MRTSPVGHFRGGYVGPERARARVLVQWLLAPGAFSPPAGRARRRGARGGHGGRARAAGRRGHPRAEAVLRAIEAEFGPQRPGGGGGGGGFAGGGGCGGNGSGKMAGSGFGERATFWTNLAESGTYQVDSG